MRFIALFSAVDLSAGRMHEPVNGICTRRFPSPQSFICRKTAREKPAATSAIIKAVQRLAGCQEAGVVHLVLERNIAVQLPGDQPLCVECLSH
jgi:hypothetical protein